MSKLSIPNDRFVFLPFGPRVPLDEYGTTLVPYNLDKHLGATSVRALDAANPAGVVLFGGDMNGLSYRSEVRFLDPAIRLASDDPRAGWTMLYPYCGPPGRPQPKGPDHVVLVETGDGRLVFAPGQIGTHSSSQRNIPGETLDNQLDNNVVVEGGPLPIGPTLLAWHTMTFDRVARRWADHGRQPKVSPSDSAVLGGDTWYAVYDAPTDRIVKLTTGAKRIAWARMGNLAAWTFVTPNLFGLDTTQKSVWAHDKVGRRVFMVNPNTARVFVLALDTFQVTDLGPIPGGHIAVDGTRGYCFWQPDIHALLVQRYAGARESLVFWPDESPRRWQTLALPVEGIPLTVPSSRRVVCYRGGCWAEDAEAFVLLAPGADGSGPDGVFLLRLSTGGTPIPPPGGVMKTATFVITMADETYVAGTPTPTHMSARAERDSSFPPKTPVTVPWSSTETLVPILMQFDSRTEAGVWQGFVDLIAGTTVLKSLGPVAFQIPAAPVSYRSPAAFTVAVQ